MTEITAKTPWAGHTGDVPLHLDYFDGSMFEALELVAKRYPRNIAFDFMGKPTAQTQATDVLQHRHDRPLPGEFLLCTPGGLCP